MTTPHDEQGNPVEPTKVHRSFVVLVYFAPLVWAALGVVSLSKLVMIE